MALLQESSRKKIYFCFIDYAKAFDCVDHNKLWKILKEMGIQNHLTSLLRNLLKYSLKTQMATHSSTLAWKSHRQMSVLDYSL